MANLWLLSGSFVTAILFRALLYGKGQVDDSHNTNVRKNFATLWSYVLVTFKQSTFNLG